MPYVTDPGGLDRAGGKKDRPGSVEDRVASIVSALTGLPRDEITPDVDVLGQIDSPDGIELIMTLEEEFDLTIPDEDAIAIRTVGQAVQYIKDHIQ